MKFLKSPDHDFIEVTSLGYGKSKKCMAVAYIKHLDKRAYVDVHHIRNADHKFKHILSLDLFDGQEPPTTQRYISSVAISNDGLTLIAVMTGAGGIETKVIVYKLTNNTGPWVARV
jgi:hypothetical protein